MTLWQPKNKKIVTNKGQIKSEWIYEIINFPKHDPKNLKDFCPMYCRCGRVMADDIAYAKIRKNLLI